jgi:superfamily II RNA helicase
MEKNTPTSKTRIAKSQNNDEQSKNIQEELSRIEADVRKMQNNFQEEQENKINEIFKRIENLQKQINEITQNKNWSVNIDLNSFVEQKIKEYFDSIIKTSAVVITPRSIENTKREEPVFSNTIQKSNEPINKLFAELPHNNRFHKVLYNLVSCETYFIIDKDKSTFSLVKDEETLNYAFGLIDTLKPACNLLSTGAPNINNYRIEKEGTVELVDGLWIIKEKIKLNWGDSS